MLAGCTVDGHPCFQDGVPESFEFQLLPEDWYLIRKMSYFVYSTNKITIFTVYICMHG